MRNRGFSSSMPSVSAWYQTISFDALPFRLAFLMEDPRPRAQSATPAGQSIMQDGLASVAEELQNQNGRSHPSRKSLLIRGAVYANISAQGRATSRRAGPCGHSEDWYQGIDAQAGSTTPALDTRTVSVARKQNAWSGTSTWLETVARVSSHLRIRFSLLYRSSRDSFCKSSSALTASFNLDGPHTEVTGVPREPKDVIFVHIVTNY